jgi:CheY-like chemotaxis protein
MADLPRIRDATGLTTRRIWCVRIMTVTSAVPSYLGVMDGGRSAVHAVTYAKRDRLTSSPSPGCEAPVIVLRSLVTVVDDDESVRESLPDLLRELGFAVNAFSSAEQFLASDSVRQTRCLILDIAMPGMTGPELQRELSRRRHTIPIVFITAHQDDAVRPRVLAQGAVECLFKPFSEGALLDAVTAALQEE